MNLEACVERDMVRFLDSAVDVAEKTDIPRQEDAASMYANQWQEDIRSHLARGDLEGAKKIFGQLKDKYNSTPEDHPEERKRLYELIQASYVDIVNHLQERERTAEMLRKMESAPSDVFDMSVRPVNLQTVERVEHVRETRSETAHTAQPNVVVVQVPAPSMPLYAPPPLPAPPASREAPPAPMPVAPIAPIIIAAPPVAVPLAAPAASAPPTPVVVAAPAPTVVPVPLPAQGVSGAHDGERRERQIVAIVRSTIRRCVELGKTDPAQALAELKELGTTLLSEERNLHVSHLIAKDLLGSIEQAERDIQSLKDRQNFERSFQTSYAQLLALARSKQAQAVPLFVTLREKAEEFERSPLGTEGQYTGRLRQLHDTYGLYTEEEVVARIAPLITRLKVAQQTRSLTAYDHALADLERFSRVLPHTTERGLLERSIQSLRARRAALQQSLSTQSLLSEDRG